MILNISGRTDIVQYYTKWLLNRLDAGFVYARNPMFREKVTRFELSPKTVDVLVFCSKNYKPLLPYVARIIDKFNTYFHYTITAYGKDIEPGVPEIDQSIDTLIALSEIVGKDRVAWRYDPVLLTRKYTIARHLETFDRMAEQLAPHIDRCIFSFVDMYRKLLVNMPEIEPFTFETMDALAKGLGQIAILRGIYLQTCALKGDYSAYGIHKSGCVTPGILSRANHIEFKSLRFKGMRNNCGCMEWHDFGTYNTCPNGCKYCYANKNPELAKESYKLHDPCSPLLLGILNDSDIVTKCKERSLLKPMDNSVWLDL
ncbi:MAG: DUF1848 domain-containing protein [Fibrobacteraceae bacterium]|nr:DUF1848 domain-containing protein [Fibrobacteraceae bacterium]